MDGSLQLSPAGACLQKPARTKSKYKPRRCGMSTTRCQPPSCLGRGRRIVDRILLSFWHRVRLAKARGEGPKTGPRLVFGPRARPVWARKLRERVIDRCMSAELCYRDACLYAWCLPEGSAPGAPDSLRSGLVRLRFGLESASSNQDLWGHPHTMKTRV